MSVQPHPINTWPQVADVRTRIGGGLLFSVFDAALKSFEQYDNPLHLNNFAMGLRELLRLVLRDLAPDDQIKACGWYTEETDKNGNAIITRAQRIRFAVQAGLPSDFVQDTLGIDVGKTCAEFSALVQQLSKYTHVEQSTFGADDATSDSLAVEALETFSALYATIEECRVAVHHAAEIRVREALNDRFSSDIVEELAELATHYTASEVVIETVEILSMDANSIHVTATGVVECEFQYGSSSDVAKGDGLVTEDSYPLKCCFVAMAHSPLELNIVSGSLIVDNSSFYA